jgi:hypothetical protein
MARGSGLWYLVASLVITLAVYEVFQYTTYDESLGPLLTGLIYVFTFPLGIAAWTYRDARDRAWSGAFWAAVTVFVPIGIVIYLIARKPRGLETRGSIWYVMYGIVLPLLLLVVGLITTYGGILLVMAVFVWMGFAIIIAAPAKDRQTP